MRTRKAPKTGCSLCGHEEHAEHLADAGEATRVDLADVYRVRLEELLEHHPVVRVLTRRDADSMLFQRATNGRVPKDVVRRRGLLDEPNQLKGAPVSPRLCFSDPRPAVEGETRQGKKM